MDIGNLPIYSGDKTKHESTTKERVLNSQPEKKSLWDQIGDYEDKSTNNNNTATVDEDDEENYEQPKLVSKLNSNKKDSAKASCPEALKESLKTNQL